MPRTVDRKTVHSRTEERNAVGESGALRASPMRSSAPWRGPTCAGCPPVSSARTRGTSAPRTRGLAVGVTRQDEKHVREAVEGLEGVGVIADEARVHRAALSPAHYAACEV